MKVIHFSAVHRRDGKRVVSWGRLLVFSAAAGFGSGGAFEFLRWLSTGAVSARSLVLEAGMIGLGAAALLLADGLLKPLERLYPAEDIERKGSGEMETVKTVEIPGRRIGKD